MQDMNRLGRAEITYSFADIPVTEGGPSLSDRLGVVFGDNDLGKELIRQGIARWVRSGGIEIREVGDDPGTPINGSSPDRNPSGPEVGDIRIRGGLASLTNDCPIRPSTLGGSASPCAGADLWIATGEVGYPERYDKFVHWNNLEEAARALRNAVSHEFGHSLGFLHFNPMFGFNLMESTVPVEIEALAPQDLRNLHASYGDRIMAASDAGNLTAATAYSFGDLSERSVFEPGLSVKRPAAQAACPDLSDPQCYGGPASPADDWFSFTLAEPRDVVLSVQPSGGEYWASRVAITGGATSQMEWVDGKRAGKLALCLYSRSSTGDMTLIESAVATQAGDSVRIVRSLLPATAAGQSYRVLVRQLSLEPGQYEVQLYNLAIRVDEFRVPPRAVAGINKRVKKDSTAYFIGDILSQALEPGAGIRSYRWFFDESTVPVEGARVCKTWHAEEVGLRHAKLEVTDTYGNVSTDTIEVLVVP